MSDFNLSGEYHTDCNMLMERIKKLEAHALEMEQERNSAVEECQHSKAKLIDEKAILRQNNEALTALLELMKPTIEQILEGAPEGATHVGVYDNQYVEYWKVKSVCDDDEYYCFERGNWSEQEYWYGHHLLSDLETIIAQAEEIERLREYKSLAEEYLTIYRCAKCNGLVNLGHICLHCGDDEPTSPPKGEGK